MSLIYSIWGRRWLCLCFPQKCLIIRTPSFPLLNSSRPPSWREISTFSPTPSLSPKLLRETEGSRLEQNHSKSFFFSSLSSRQQPIIYTEISRFSLMASSPLCNHGYCGLTVPAPSPLHPACIRPNHRTGHLYLFCTENRRRSQKPRYQDNGVPAFRTEKSKEKQTERTESVVVRERERQMDG